MATLRRTFYSGQRDCPFGCSYCFAHSPSFKSSLWQGAFERFPLEGGSIVYPACDSEVVLDARLIAGIQAAAAKASGMTIVSVSTKAAISPRVADALHEINVRLRSNGGGFIKVSASITTKHAIAELEPRTAGYAARLRGLQMLAERDIPCAVSLKPILPDVSPGEYIEIMDDFAPVTRLFLVGGLYLDPDTEFGQTHIRTHADDVVARRVEWLPNHPIWPYIEPKRQLEGLRAHAGGMGYELFDDDVALISWILQRNPQRLLNNSEHAA